MLVTTDVYGGTHHMAEQILPTQGMDVEFIDLTDPNIIHEKVKSNTKVHFMDTSNLIFKGISIG